MKPYGFLFFLGMLLTAFVIVHFFNGTIVYIKFEDNCKTCKDS